MHPTSIVSYAGLEESALWESAKRMFALADDYVPERFRSFLPLFPAELVVTLLPSDTLSLSDAYHRQLYQRMPGLYAFDNLKRLMNSEGRFLPNAVITADAVWTAQFPQYLPFEGEKLFIHLIGGGCEAVAVPQSIFPRGGGVLAGAEKELHITERAQHYASYVRRRAEEEWNPDQWAQDYLAEEKLHPLSVTQRKMNRVLQELHVMRTMETGALFEPDPAQDALVPQYAPYRYACDFFEETPVTRAFARLMQLSFSGDRNVRDLWIPYQDAACFIHQKRRTLDVRALCEAFQIAPACDPSSRGGVYPDRIRTVVVRDKTLRMMAADACCNPAYGSGTGPQGVRSRLVYLPDSARLLKEKRLGEEPCPVTPINTRAEEDEYLLMRRMAEMQELRGQLIDAMYCREKALAELEMDSPAYARACELLTARVIRLERQLEGLPLSGSRYDEDISYLRLQALCREEQKPFTPDDAQEKRLAAGYAMRHVAPVHTLSELYLKPSEEKPKPIAPQAVRPRREQASNGMWFEQMFMFDETPENEGGTQP